MTRYRKTPSSSSGSSSLRRTTRSRAAAHSNSAHAEPSSSTARSHSPLSASSHPHSHSDCESEFESEQDQRPRKRLRNKQHARSSDQSSNPPKRVTRAEASEGRQPPAQSDQPLDRGRSEPELEPESNFKSKAEPGPEHVSHDDVLSSAESSMLLDLLRFPADVQPGTGIPPPGPLPPPLAHRSTVVSAPDGISTSDNSDLTSPSDQGPDEHRGTYSDVEVSRHLGITELDSDAEVNRDLGVRRYDVNVYGTSPAPEEPQSEPQSHLPPANRTIKVDPVNERNQQQEYQPKGLTNRDSDGSDQATSQQSPLIKQRDSPLHAIPITQPTPPQAASSAPAKQSTEFESDTHPRFLTTQSTSSDEPGQPGHRTITVHDSAAPDVGRSPPSLSGVHDERTKYPSDASTAIPIVQAQVLTPVPEQGEQWDNPQDEPVCLIGGMTEPPLTPSVPGAPTSSEQPHQSIEPDLTTLPGARKLQDSQVSQASPVTSKAFLTHLLTSSDEEPGFQATEVPKALPPSVPRHRSEHRSPESSRVQGEEVHVHFDDEAIPRSGGNLPGAEEEEEDGSEVSRSTSTERDLAQGPKNDEDQDQEDQDRKEVDACLTMVSMAYVQPDLELTSVDKQEREFKGQEEYGDQARAERLTDRQEAQDEHRVDAIPTVDDGEHEFGGSGGEYDTEMLDWKHGSSPSQEFESEQHEFTAAADAAGPVGPIVEQDVVRVEDDPSAAVPIDQSAQELERKQEPLSPETLPDEPTDSKVQGSSTTAVFSAEKAKQGSHSFEVDEEDQSCSELGGDYHPKGGHSESVLTEIREEDLRNAVPSDQRVEQVEFEQVEFEQVEFEQDTSVAVPLEKSVKPAEIPQESTVAVAGDQSIEAFERQQGLGDTKSPPEPVNLEFLGPSTTDAGPAAVEQYLNAPDSIQVDQDPIVSEFDHGRSEPLMSETKQEEVTTNPVSEFVALGQDESSQPEAVQVSTTFFETQDDAGQPDAPQPLNDSVPTESDVDLGMAEADPTEADDTQVEATGVQEPEVQASGVVSESYDTTTAQEDTEESESSETFEDAPEPRIADDAQVPPSEISVESDDSDSSTSEQRAVEPPELDSEGEEYAAFLAAPTPPRGQFGIYEGHSDSIDSEEASGENEASADETSSDEAPRPRPHEYITISDDNPDDEPESDGQLVHDQQESDESEEEGIRSISPRVEEEGEEDQWSLSRSRLAPPEPPPPPPQLTSQPRRRLPTVAGPLARATASQAPRSAIAQVTAIGAAALRGQDVTTSVNLSFSSTRDRTPAPVYSRANPALTKRPFPTNLGGRINLRPPPLAHRRDPLSARQHKLKLEATRRSHSARQMVDLLRRLQPGRQWDYRSNRNAVDAILKGARVLRTIDETPYTPTLVLASRSTGRTDEYYQRRAAEHFLNRERDLGSTVGPSATKLSEYARLRSERADRERKLRGILGRKPFPDQLDDKQEGLVQEAFRDFALKVSIPGGQVLHGDIAKLRARQWLNDESINFYGILLMQRSQRTAQLRKDALAAGASKVPMEYRAYWDIYYFNSFFYGKISTGGHKAVARWTRKFDVFAKDKIIFPVNLGNSHWVTGCINMRQRRIEYYDSMHAPNAPFFHHVRAWLDAEHQAKRGTSLDFDTLGWEDYTNPLFPSQFNAYDCGVFTISALEQLSRRDPLLPFPSPFGHDTGCATPPDEPTVNLDREDHMEFNFTATNMPYLRRRLVYELINKTLLDSC